MTTQHIIEPGQAVHQAAAILSSLQRFFRVTQGVLL